MPSFRFLYRPSVFCTLVPVFGVQEHPPNHSFGNHFFFVRSPQFGVGRRGHPDVFRFVPISQCSSDLHSLFSGFVPICPALFSEQIRSNQGNPFLPTPFPSPPFCEPLRMLMTCGPMIRWLIWNAQEATLLPRRSGIADR